MLSLNRRCVKPQKKSNGFRCYAMKTNLSFGKKMVNTTYMAIKKN